jgi:hypothetical protein
MQGLNPWRSGRCRSHDPMLIQHDSSSSQPSRSPAYPCSKPSSAEMPSNFALINVKPSPGCREQKKAVVARCDPMNSAPILCWDQWDMQDNEPICARTKSSVRLIIGHILRRMPGAIGVSYKILATNILEGTITAFAPSMNACQSPMKSRPCNALADLLGPQRAKSNSKQGRRTPQTPRRRENGCGLRPCLRAAPGSLIGQTRWRGAPAADHHYLQLKGARVHSRRRVGKDTRIFAYCLAVEKNKD